MVWDVNDLPIKLSQKHRCLMKQKCYLFNTHASKPSLLRYVIQVDGRVDALLRSPSVALVLHSH